METLVAVAQHRNQYYSPSPPSRGLKDINCRSFHSGEGILPTPLRACTTSVTKHAFSVKTPSPSVVSCCDGTEHFKNVAKSSTIAIPINIKADAKTNRSFSDEFPFYELWAGPAYSNSPPASSVPMPKFSLRPKRTVSLDMPGSSASDIEIHPMAKSAPPSPTGDYKTCSRNIFCGTDSATENLRRILNLDIADE